MFEERSLTDIFEGSAEEELNSSSERIKVQLKENSKVKTCVFHGSLVQTETGVAGADTPCSSHLSSGSEGRGGSEESEGTAGGPTVNVQRCASVARQRTVAASSLQRSV